MYYYSIRFAWISIALLIFISLKYIARKSGKQSINKFFKKYHILTGILMIITVSMHGIFAGNEITTTIEDIRIASKFFTLNLGTICFVIILALLSTYLLRRQLKKKWIIFHQGLTVLLLILVVLHICCELKN